MSANGQPLLYSLYVYAPDKWAPIVFTLIFALSAGFHIWQCTRYRSWKLIGLHPVCAVFFTAGYALRTVNAFDFRYLYSSTNLIIYILSQVFIFICPPLLELANYHVLGRVFYYVPHKAPLPPSKVLATFGGLIALVEVLNSLGVAFTSNPTSGESRQKMGSNLVKAALAIQIAVVVIFIALAGSFHWKCLKGKIRSRNVFVPLYTLYASMVLIFVRCMYRLIEHTGNTSIDIENLDAMRALTPILRWEWYFYVFEASLMFLNSALWNVFSPGRFLPESYLIYISEDGTTELRGQGEVDQRTMLQKIGHIFTFGIFWGKKKGHGRMPSSSHEEYPLVIMRPPRRMDVHN